MSNVTLLLYFHIEIWDFDTSHFDSMQHVNTIIDFMIWLVPVHKKDQER